METILGIIGGVITLLAYVFYIRDAIQAQRQENPPLGPNRVTWIIWTIIPILAFISSFIEGARATLWLSGAYIVGSSLTLLLALKYGKAKLSKIDELVIGITCSGILIWLMSGNPLLGLVCFIAADFSGAIPTFIQAWNIPKSESKLGWSTFLVGTLFTLGAVGSEGWNNLAVWLYPVVIAFVQAAILILLFIPTSKK